MTCAALKPMLTLTSTSSSMSSCVVATILEGASCYDLAPHFYFLWIVLLLCHLPYLTLVLTFACLRLLLYPLQSLGQSY
jgi:hypothetical protein